MDNWNRINSHNVRHHWICIQVDCEGSKEERNACVDPVFYERSGTPVCGACDTDMVYIATEVCADNPDTEVLNWILAQGDWFSWCLLEDCCCGHSVHTEDGDYTVYGRDTIGQGATFRDAVRAAIAKDAL